MRRRRLRDGGTNLDLMLDAICNVFGGIILVTILVVLQTQTTAGNFAEPSTEELAMSLEGRRLRSQMARLQEEIEDLKRQERAVDNALRSVGSANALKIIGAKTEFKQAISDATGRIKTLQTRFEKATNADKPVAVDLARTQERLKLKKEEGERLTQQLASLASKPRKSVRLPHRRGLAQGTGRYYVIRKDRVYGCDSGSLRRWKGTPYRLEDCTVTPMPSGKAARIRPVDGTGVIVSEQARGLDDFFGTLRTYDPRSHYIVFFVYLDNESYSSFQILKAAVLKKGYSYAVCPKFDLMPDIVVTPTLGHETE